MKETKCKQCNKIFPSNKKMNEHYKKIHALENKKRQVYNFVYTKFKCKYCGQIIQSKGNLTQHIRAKHDKNYNKKETL